MNIYEEVTNDFCDSFATKEDCVGSMATMIAISELPYMVDGNDLRVKQIVMWCKENINV